MDDPITIDPEQALDEEFREKWIQKKLDAWNLAEVYRIMGQAERSQRVLDCGTYLDFVAPEDLSEKPKLQFANFCRDRLCPMCNWRRTMKIFGQVSKVMELIGKKYRFIFCTLTVRNCSGEELPGLVDQMQKAWDRLMHWKATNAFKGWFRALEITRHPEYRKEIQYHPHFHIIFAVNPSYFKEAKEYISQRKMGEIWQKAMKLDYSPVIDLRTVKPKETRETPENGSEVPEWAAVAEVAKYAVKSADYLRGRIPEVQESVAVFLRSLEGRRLCSYGGVFKEARKQLQLDDETDGDLIHTDPNEEIRADLAYILIRYQWQIGLGYVLTDIRPFKKD